MKTLTKCLIIGIILLVAGLTLIITGLFIDDNGSKNYGTEIYTATENVALVHIDAECAIVTVGYYDVEYAEITYPTSYKRENAVYIQSGILVVKSEVNSIFYHVNVNNTDCPELTVKLPYGTTISLELELDYGGMNVLDGEYGKLEISLDAGAVNVGYAVCNALDIEINAGEVNITRADCADTNIEVNAGTLTAGLSCETASIEVNAGSLVANFSGCKSEYTVNSEVYLGSCNIYSQSVTSSKRIDIEVNIGSAEIYFEG